jgi:hypothetical protein
VNAFLKNSKCQKLFFIDDDIIFTYEQFERLLCWSTKFPIVCGTYPVRQFPTKYFVKYNQDKPEVNEYGLLRIQGCGLGFTIIDRSVFENMEAPLYVSYGEEMKAYFDIKFENGQLAGEDMLFFGTQKEVWLDPLVDVKHFGNHLYEGDFAGHLSKQLLEG